MGGVGFKVGQVDLAGVLVVSAVVSSTQPHIKHRGLR